jgi:uncharacterized membrane protein
MALLVSGILRGGVILAAAVTLAGGIPYVVHHGSEHPNYHTFRGANAPFRSPAEILHGAAALGFAAQRDWTYLVITTVVLAILFYSLLTGAAG